MTARVEIPALQTARLRLRAHVPGEFPAIAALMGSDRARLMGGPDGERMAWYGFAADTGSWVLLGHGARRDAEAGAPDAGDLVYRNGGGEGRA